MDRVRQRRGGRAAGRAGRARARDAQPAPAAGPSRDAEGAVVAPARREHGVPAALDAALVRHGVQLSDGYLLAEGPVLLNGRQALVRSALDARRSDRARGLNTGMYLSGYPGSPLGGIDQELARQRSLLSSLGAVAAPGLNEELAATAVAGTQLLGSVPGRRHDGVTGIWYGKAPGLDRAADAIRHGNITGTAPLGGAVAWIGDDPAAKSSTVPSSSEPLCRSLHLPLLAPGSVAELLTFGQHAIALSRHAGSWAGLKVVADVADASATVQVGPVLLPELPPREASTPPVLLPPTNLDAELDLFELRLGRAREYAREAGLNRVVAACARPRLTIVAAGMGFAAVERALSDLGLAGNPGAAGIRLVQLGMPWPLGRDEVRGLLRRSAAVLVVEDKLPFLEPLLRDALYRTADAPLILGKEDAEGRPLLSSRSALEADDVARALGRLLGEELPEAARARLVVLNAMQRRGQTPSWRDDDAKRTPYFCSGCPHNVSTRAEADTLVGVGIGCHVMVVLDSPDRRGTPLGMPQMGGEGTQWLGLAPFTEEEHFVQNLGDGTFHHSGSLAIRAAVAGGASMTYRLLYNDAVAMTGGQAPQGKLAVPALTKWLELEGVARTVVTTPEPSRYDGVALAANTTVRHRDDLSAVQAELKAVPGVTVLIHDDQCATEKRRLRKRGKLAKPAEQVVINERVCEGCGDCGDVSSCLSVLPKETEFGRKTEIHQGSCNQDRTCLQGDCPSFLLVTPSSSVHGRGQTPSVHPPVLDAPLQRRVGSDVLVRMPGVGGTGVVTIAAILQMAAHLDGLHAAGLEQIGLAQKGGPVLSDLRISTQPIGGALRAGSGAADVLLGFDLLGASAKASLDVCAPDRTVAVLNTGITPTAAHVTDPSLPPASVHRARRKVRAVTKAGEELCIDAAGLAERLFGDHLPANTLLVGAAYQHGCLPLRAEAIEAAIRLNGAAVEQNLLAFAWGRAAVADPAAVEAAIAPPATAAEPELDPRALQLVAAHAAAPLPGVPRLPGGFGSELQRLVAIRASELIAFQDEKLAKGYVEEVARVATRERRQTGANATPVAEAYARGLHRLLAYKDEYEVARLHTLELAKHAQGADKVEVLLHPPLLKALGMDKKLRLGPSAFKGLSALQHAKRLRGTKLDPFGRAEVRKVERALPAEYRTLVAQALEHLRPATVEQVTAIAALPDVVRGYEDIKLRNVERFREQAAQRLSELRAQPVASPLTVLKVG